MPKKSTEWLDAHFAMIMSGLGITGNRLYSLFQRWFRKDTEDVLVIMETETILLKMLMGICKQRAVGLSPTPL